MTQEHPSKLSFSIEESVWLNKGQEVKEILSMSLEPDIVIEEKNQHVYIKGGLQLVGEYKAVSKEESDLNPEESLEEQLTYRSVEEVEVDEEGKGEIKHFFPIDVTIPLSRIQNLDDIFVDVENFDYDLPEKSCIQLTADIGISGMSTVQDAPVNTTIEEEAEEETEEETVRETEDEKSFSFDARKEAQTIAPLNVVNTEPPQEIDHNPTEPSNDLLLEPKNSEEEETEVKGQYQQNFEEEKLSTIIDSIEEKQKEEQRKQPSANIKQPEEQVNSKVERVEQKKELELMRTVSEEIEEETEEETVEHTPQRKSENALYLTKMLTKGEENFSRWKMCIIQENESLDSIAERYEISTTQLVRFNRLKEEKVEEGQILYIPVTNQ